MIDQYNLKIHKINKFKNKMELAGIDSSGYDKTLSNKGNDQLTIFEFGQE